jgi:hypothetical protein
MASCQTDNFGTYLAALRGFPKDKQTPAALVMLVAASGAWRSIKPGLAGIGCKIGLRLIACVGLTVFSSLTLTRGAIADACSDAQAAVKDISSFNDCINTCQGGKATDTSNTVQCLPAGCKVTLTMSPDSAQAACTLGGCQLPRVILDCSSKTDKTLPPFRPSYLLCPKDSKRAGNQFGNDRIEIGQDKDNKAQSVMFMADIPVPPGQNYAKLMLQDILSQFKNTKGCNSCHDAPNPRTAKIMGIDGELSQPISPIGESQENTQLAPYVIDTQDGNLQKMADAKIEQLKKDKPDLKIPPLGTDGKPIKKQKLPEICDCIIADNADGMNIAKQARGTGEPALNEALLVNLCNALKDYQTKRSCGKDPPDSVAPMACLGVLGGGKFLSASSAVSWLSLDLSGNAAMESVNSFTFTNFDGGASAFAYLTHTLIDPIVLSSLSGTASTNGDVTVTGTGVATVNGATLEIELDAASTNGIVTFSITDLASGKQLAGGTGEDGLAGLELTSTGSDP